MISLLRSYKQHWPLALLLALGLWNAWGNAFIQDDAYISYTYAKWFSRGYGLVWYPGSTEFGYSNFLYTLMIGVGMLLRLPPEIASNIINVASFTGCLCVAYKISSRALGHGFLALLPIVLLVTDHTFTSYATGGLETMFVTLLVLLFYERLLAGRNDYLRLGVIAALAMLTRLDAALLLLPGYLFMLAQPAVRREFSDAVIVPAVATLGLFLCCYLAYGQALPNTFYIKIPGADSLLPFGLRYLWLYTMLHMYLPLLVPFVLLYFFIRRDVIARMGIPATLLAAVLLLWVAYVAFVGGDFMEFRFLVPVMAFFYIVVFRLALALLPARQGLWAALLAALFLAGNWLHPTLFTSIPNKYDLPMRPVPFAYALVENTETLNDWLTYKNTNWRAIGEGMGKLFAGSGVKLATSAIGAITFYSGLPTVDVLGLNTRAVIGDHDSFMNRPGHHLKASDALLAKLAVNLNLSHPQTLCKSVGRYVHTVNPSDNFYFARHQTLFLPIGNNCFVAADYITPHPKIEEMLKTGQIIRYRDVANRTDCPAWLCLR